MIIDMHVHTCEGSRCGKVPGKEMVALYKNAGYDAICITNHFSLYTVAWMAKQGKIDFVKNFENAYQIAKEEGDRIGLRVFRGYEFRCNRHDNDFLIYDFPKCILDNVMQVFNMPINDCLAAFRANGVKVFQAHPFRNNTTMIDPMLLDGIEVYNGSNGPGVINDMAKVWADAHPHLLQISGSDAHAEAQVGKCGIETDEDIRTQEDLLRLLESGNFKTIKRYE